MAMTLTDGYADVPPGKIAAVVTSLEMLMRVAPRMAAPRTNASRKDASRADAPRADARNGARGDENATAGIRELRHAERPDPVWYRDLFKRVGEPWLWFSRLMMPDPELTEIIHDPRIDVFALWQGDRAEGLLELDFRVDGECELSFFGVTPPLVGSGAGRLMMNHAIARAWSHPTRPIRRFWLHTCSLDHPNALSFYTRSGFVPYRRQIEIADDPRLTGGTSKTAAPHVPIIAAR
jgi:GNAT superfamily N-acetyltransferase